MPKPKRKAARFGLAFYVGLLLAAALVLTELYQDQKNTLYENGNWQSVKTSLAKGVVGAVAFVTTRNALAGHRLNLGTWHGLNEVLYRKSLPLAEVEFDFRLEGHAYLIFEYNRGKVFSGIRFSRSDYFNNIVFTASADGGFKTKNVFEARMRNGWNHVLTRFDESGTSFFLNGEKVANDPRPPAAEQTIGFRASTDPASVTHIALKLKNSGEVIRENFRNPHHRWTVFTVILVVLFLLSLIFHDPYARVVMLVVIVLCCTAAYAADFYWFSRRYIDKATAFDELLLKVDVANSFHNNIEGPDTILDRISQRFRLDDPAKFRIVLLGSSQTWGAGAKTPEEDIASQLESELNRRQGPSFECINPSFSGAVASDLWPIYWKQIARFHPKIAVINLSNNDHRPERFKETLEKWVRFNDKKGIHTVFVLEANFVELKSVSLVRNHEIMREVARSMGVPVIDMHAFMAKNADTGIAWWDDVHMTSFGQKLVALRLYEGLLPLIRKSP